MRARVATTCSLGGNFRNACATDSLSPRSAHVGASMSSLVVIQPGARTRRPQMIASRVRGDSPHPSTEAPRRIKPGSRAIRPPECLDEDVFGCACIPDNPQDPVKNLDLELPEERFERVLVALYEPPEEFAVQLVRHRLLPCLTRPVVERFHLISTIKSAALQFYLVGWTLASLPMFAGLATSKLAIHTIGNWIANGARMFAVVAAIVITVQKTRRVSISRRASA